MRQKRAGIHHLCVQKPNGNNNNPLNTGRGRRSRLHNGQAAQTPSLVPTLVPFVSLAHLSIGNISEGASNATAPALKDFYGRCSAVSARDGFSPYLPVTLEPPAREILLQVLP